MRYVIGDIHGCGYNLETLLASLVNPTRIYAVGDLFDRGIHCYKVWQLIKKWNIVSTMGNHELKMLSFLTGMRDHLPPHYYYAIDQLFRNGVSRQELIDYLSGLPRIINLTALGRETIIAHAGIDWESPSSESDEFNVYGIFETQPWWELYTGFPLVIYGHLSQEWPNATLPRLGNTMLEGQEIINSIGLDTAAVAGGSLTAYSLDTVQFTQVPCLWDFGGILKADLAHKGKPWRDKMRVELSPV